MGAKMKTKSIVCLGMLFGCMILTQIQTDAKEVLYVDKTNPYLTTSSRYDHIYANPPRQSLGAMGRYIFSSSKVRYIHSPSRMKGAKHAARINANNYYYYN